MTKVLSFKVYIENLEDKIWRIIEITDKKTVADLAYTILASFDSLAYHLYSIQYDNKEYECGMFYDQGVYDNEFINAINTGLSDLNLNKNDILEMEYDSGSPTTFKIVFLDSRDMEKSNGHHYPYIVNGSGRGMIDDISDVDLKEIVDDIDKKGYSNHYFTPGYERTIKYDYRDFNIKYANKLLKGDIEYIKEKYEEEW